MSRNVDPSSTFAFAQDLAVLLFFLIAVVKVSLRLAWYQHVPPPSHPHLLLASGFGLDTRYGEPACDGPISTVALAVTERIMLGALNHFLHYRIDAVGGRIHEENGDFTL